MLIRTRVQVVTRYPDGRVYSAGQGVTSIIDDGDEMAVEHMRYLAARGQVDILDEPADPDTGTQGADPADGPVADDTATVAAAADPEPPAVPEPIDASGITVPRSMLGEPTEPAAEGSDQYDRAPDVDLDLLRETAARLGVRVDRRWGSDRLRREIDTARQAVSQ